MLRLIRQSLVILVLMSAITGIMYPLLVTGIAQWLFPRQANGSLIVKNGQAVGSQLIGQPFSDPGYFWPRLSATTPVAYNAASSSGSNLGPLNPALAENVKKQATALRASDPAGRSSVPVDLVTASGSGLDPDISPAAAEYQIARVAKARHIAEQQVRDLVAQNTQPRQLGILGEPRVNVLGLNLALDDLRR